MKKNKFIKLNTNATGKRTGEFDSSFESVCYNEVKDLPIVHNKRNANGKVLPYQTLKKYYTDFVYIKNDCKPMYIETKGYFKGADRTKMLAVKDTNPGADIRLVFQHVNWISKRHIKRYSDWARINDFKYAIGSIPREWLKE